MTIRVTGKLSDAFLENTPPQLKVDYVFIESAEELMTNLHSEMMTYLPDLLDLTWRYMLGLQALKEDQADKGLRHITIYCITTHPAPDRKSSYALGANCFLSKPGFL